MALLFMDGFDTYGDNDDMYSTYHLAECAINTTIKHTGRASALLSGSGDAIHWLLPGAARTSGRVILGAHVYIDYSSDVGWKAPLIIGDAADGSNDILRLQVQSSTKKWRIVNADLSITDTHEGSFAAFDETWVYMELMVDIGTTGLYEWRVNGLTTLSGTGNTDVNGNGADRIKLQWASTSGIRFDNIYVSDNTGSLNTGFMVKPALGHIIVQTLVPSADGHLNQWTPSSGSENYPNVDETTPNFNTDYNSGTADNQEDYYACGDLTTGTPDDGVKAVMVQTFSANSNPTKYKRLRHMVYTSSQKKQGGTLHEVGQKVNSSPTYGPLYPTQETMFETNAQGTTWTVNDVNGLEIGQKVEA